MADFNTKAKLIFSELNDKEQEKALSILKTLDNLEIERANCILEFCKEGAISVAVVDTKKLFTNAPLDESMGQKVVPNYIRYSESGKA